MWDSDDDLSETIHTEIEEHPKPKLKEIVCHTLTEWIDGESGHNALFSSYLCDYTKTAWKKVQASVLRALNGKPQTVEYYFDPDNRGKIGRYKARIKDGEPGQPAQNIKRLLRGSFFKANTIDIDMENCHYNIMASLNKKFEYTNLHIDNYIANRKEIISRYSKCMKIEPSEIKTIFITVMYGGNIRAVLRRHGVSDSNDAFIELCEFADAMKSNSEHIVANAGCRHAVDMYCLRNENKTKYNELSRKLSLILQTHERECLDEFIRLVKLDGFVVSSLIFDGFHIDGKMRPTPTQLNTYTTKVEYITGIHMPLSIKEFEAIPVSKICHYDNDIFRRPFEYQDFKKAWELFAFKVIIQNIYVVRMANEVIEVNAKTLKEQFGHLKALTKNKKDEDVEAPFIMMWIQDPNIRLYQKCEMKPPPLKISSGIFNTWDGFAIEKVPHTRTEPPTILLDHFHMLLQRNNEYTDYVLDWVSDIIQNPGARKPVAIVLYSSAEGCGKNALCEIIKKVIGVKYILETDKPEECLLGLFTKSKENKLLTIINEMESSIGFKNKESIKNMITETDFQVNEKYATAYRSLNMSRYIFTSNNACPVSISKTDRRFVVFECSNEMVDKKDEYFVPLYDAMGDETQIRALYQFFKDRRIMRNIDGDRPKTELYKIIKESSTPPFNRWLFDYCEEHIEEEPRTVLLCDMFQSYKNWNGANNAGYEISKNKFSRQMKMIYVSGLQTKMCGIDLESSNGSKVYLKIVWDLLLKSSIPQ